MIKKLIIIFIFAILIGSYFYFFHGKKSSMTEIEKISLTTKDGVTLIGNFYENKEARFAGILIHQRPKTKESMNDLAEFLRKEGYTVLAIDLRGHGESNTATWGYLDYTKFSEEEEKKSIIDLQTASEFLKNKGYPLSRQFLIGASIGANLSFQFLSENPEIKAIILLSPGKNYRGIILENYKKEGLGEKILVISSLDDALAVEGGRLLKSWYPELNYLELQKGGHGIDMIEDQPELKDTILNFLREKLIE